MGIRQVLMMVAVLTGSTSFSANARLPEAFSNLPKEIIRNAVHVPTGCMARVTVLNRQVVHANIVDPACLPIGIKARPIPGRNLDFHIIDG